MDPTCRPHVVHKHAAFTTMFSCSIVSSLSLFAYLLLLHPWYVRPVQKGTSEIEPGILDSFKCPTSHMRQVKTGKSGGFLFGGRGCSRLDFRRIRIHFDHLWGKRSSQKQTLLDIWLRLLFNSITVHYTISPLYYRVHGSSKTGV